MNNILKGISSQKEFSEIRHRYKVHTFLKKILTKNILNFILFAYYKNSKMVIAVFHPTGQSELNFQKKMIMDYAKQTSNFSDIKEVSVFRIDMVNPFNKKYAKKEKEYTSFHSPFEVKQTEKIKINIFKERSFGIFQNKITDEKLHEKVEEIRNLIKKT